MIHREAATRTANGQLAGSRPCAHCGRPVPQPYAANQLFRYCRDNDGACQRAARRVGVHRGAGPGLGDHVARAMVVTERLEHVVDALNEALHANLSPAGVERQIAAVRAATDSGAGTIRALGASCAYSAASRGWQTTLSRAPSASSAAVSESTYRPTPPRSAGTAVASINTLGSRWCTGAGYGGEDDHYRRMA